MEIKFSMSITPNTPVKIPVAGIINLGYSIVSTTVIVLMFFNVIPTGKSQEVMPTCETIQTCEVMKSYVTKEKLQDTVDLVNIKVANLSAKMDEINKMQDKIDSKLDKIIEKLKQP